MIIPLRSKRRERAQLMQKLQHAPPAIVLLVAGLHALGEDTHGFALGLALFEIASSVLLIGTVIRALRAVRRPANAAAPLHPAHHGVDWIDIFTGSVLLAEVAERYHVDGHIVRPTLLLAVVLITIGLVHGKLAGRRQRRLTLRVDDEGLYVGGKPFRSIKVGWADVKSIDVGSRYATITLHGGRERKLDLPDLEGSNHVRAALLDAQQRVVRDVP